MLELTSTEDAAKIAQAALDETEALIGKLPVSSPLLSDFLYIIHQHDAFDAGGEWKDIYDFDRLRVVLRRSVGSLEIAKRILQLAKIGELANFIECLELLRDGAASQASIFEDYENLFHEPLNHTRKLFEFFVASGIRLNGNLPVEVAGKDDDSQKNPDVLIRGESKVKAIACKVVSGRNLQTILDNIKKGSNQIMKAKCGRGIVAVDVRHRVDEELMIARQSEDSYRTFRHPLFAQQAMQKVLAGLADAIISAESSDWWKERFEESGSRAFLLTANSCALIEHDGKPVPSNVGHGTVVSYMEEAAMALAEERSISEWINKSVVLAA